LEHCKAINKIMDTARKERATQRIKDAGNSTALDRLMSEEDLKKIGNEFLKDGNPVDIRDRAFALLCSSCCLRGDNFRRLNLSDLSAFIRPHYSQLQECTELTLTLQSSKTNPSGGRVDQVGCIRNKEVEVCPVGAVAFLLFSRFHINNREDAAEVSSKETLPNFLSYADWSQIKLAISYEHEASKLGRQASHQSRNGLMEDSEEEEDDDDDLIGDLDLDGLSDKQIQDVLDNANNLLEGDGSDVEFELVPSAKRPRLMNPESAGVDHRTIEISYGASAPRLKRILVRIGLGALKKKTHLWRVYGATQLQERGTKIDDIKILGLWNVGQSIFRYVNDAPSRAICAYAGFDYDLKNFFLKRGKAQPSEELCRKIFPFVEELEEQLNSGTGGSQSLALLGFLRILKFSRKIILQDAAALMLSGNFDQSFGIDFLVPLNLLSSNC
jgi:hypothetical protein